MTTLWFYIKALWRHWWSLMGCAAFTFLGTYIAATNRSNAWAVGSSAALGAMFFFVASYQAWKQEHESFNREVGKNQKPDIRGEAYGFGFDERAINTELVDHITNKSRVAYQFKLDLHNHRDVTTNLVAIELDGTKLPEPVKFSRIEYPQGVLLEHAKSVTVDVHVMAEAMYDPGGLKFIDLDNLKVYVIDGLHERHEISTRRGEKLTHYF